MSKPFLGTPCQRVSKFREKVFGSGKRVDIAPDVIGLMIGTSFDIGRLDSDDRAKVPLSLVKTLILKPTLLNRDEDEDDLRLTTLLIQCLVESSQPLVRGKNTPIVYVPEDDFPGAIRPIGTYSVDGNMVAVRIALKRDGNILTRLQFEGKRSELIELTERMANEIIAVLRY